MSWKDKIENSKMFIETGDGQIFDVLWKSSQSKTTEFNSVSFDFIELEGTLIERKEAKSSNYPLIIYFEGEKHLDIADQFEESAKDKRFWSIDHPYFGKLFGQPVSIERIEENLNVTAFNIDFWETILKDGVKSKKVNPFDFVVGKNNELAVEISEVVSPKIDFNPEIQSDSRFFLEKLKLRYDSILDQTNYSEFLNEFSKTLSSVDEIIESPVPAIKDINVLLKIPANIVQSLSIRLDMMKNVYNDIKELFPLTNKRNKIMFMVLGSSVVGAFAEAVLNPSEEDYFTTSDVRSVYLNLMNLYSDFINTIELNQVSFNDPRNEFHSFFSASFILSDIVQNSLFYLNSVVFNSKQEKIIELEKDSNIILLTHKYFGLDPEDKNIQTFRRINNILNRKIFKIKKGTKIKYLV